MADTTHNVTIKATLDTSTTGSSSSRSGSISSGGGSSSSSGLVLAGGTFVKTIELMRNSISALLVKLGEFGMSLTLLNSMYSTAN